MHTDALENYFPTPLINIRSMIEKGGFLLVQSYLVLALKLLFLVRFLNIFRQTTWISVKFVSKFAGVDSAKKSVRIIRLLLMAEVTSSIFTLRLLLVFGVKCKYCLEIIMIF